MPYTIFVYGTLQKGEPNYHLIESAIREGADVDKATEAATKFIGNAVTTEPRPLVVASTYGIPFLLDTTSCGLPVYGEVYQVNDPMLTILDDLESHPELYERKEIKLHMLNDDGTPTDSTTLAWCYLLTDFKESLLQSTPYLNKYGQDIVKDKKYIPRRLRNVAGNPPVKEQVKKK